VVREHLAALWARHLEHHNALAPLFRRLRQLTRPPPGPEARVRCGLIQTETQTHSGPPGVVLSRQTCSLHLSPELDHSDICRPIDGVMDGACTMFTRPNARAPRHAGREAYSAPASHVHVRRQPAQPILAAQPFATHTVQGALAGSPSWLVAGSRSRHPPMNARPAPRPPPSQ
jgi:hypothetical protein